MAKGRPKGSTKPKTITYYRRIRPEWKPILDEILFRLKASVIIELKEF